MPKSGGLQKHPTSLQSRQTRKQLWLRQFLKITLLGAGTVSRRTAKLRDVFSATAFSSRRLVNLAVFMLRHQHIKKYEDFLTEPNLTWLNSFSFLRNLIAPSRHRCTFRYRERLVFVWTFSAVSLPT